MPIIGTAGNDVITPTLLTSGVTGGIPGLADDIIYARGGADSVDGGGGNDFLYGEDGNDTLLGGAGNDLMDGGAGADSMVGGSGDDTFVVNDPGDVVDESGFGGIDTVYASLAYTIYGFVEIGRLFGGGTYLEVPATTAFGVQLVVNPTIASTIAGGAGDDVLWGGGPGGVMYGRGGNDTLRDQLVAAQMLGGVGDDQYVIGASGSVITELTGEGTDTAWVTVNSYTLSANVEIGRLGGAANLLYGSASAEQLIANPGIGSTLVGNGGDDVLWGSSRFDVLQGGDGDDTFRGQGAADRYEGGAGNDQFVVLDAATTIIELPGQGYDTIWYGGSSGIIYTMPDGVERLNAAAGQLLANGNALDNVMVGHPTLENFLFGLGGDDTLYGGTTIDSFDGGVGNDTFYTNGGESVVRYTPLDTGFDQVSGWAGGRIRLFGAPSTYGTVTFTYGDGHTQIQFLGTTILIYNALLTSNDLLFG